MKEIIVMSPKFSRTVTVYYYRPSFLGYGSYIVTCEVRDGNDLLYVRVTTNNMPLRDEVNDIELDQDRQPILHAAFFPKIQERIAEWLYLKHEK